MKRTFFAALLIFLLGSLPDASAITIDGSVSDWGVNPAAYGSSDWTPGPGIHSAVEDQSPAIDYLAPGYGGQRFDVEGIYFSEDSLYAYFAVVSGFPLEGRKEGGIDYFAGDLALDFGSDGSYEFGVETTGETPGFSTGGLYNGITWADPTFKICGPYNMLSGTYLGDTLFAYDDTAYLADGHYVFELAVSKSLFGSFWSDFGETPGFSAKWTMSCDNDCLTLDVPYAPSVPEPSTWLLFGPAAALVFLRRSRRTQADSFRR